MSSKTFNKGGQRRTLESSCGWRCVGHPSEVSKKYDRHKRHCKECGSVNLKLPTFDREAGDMNGWKGQFHNETKESISTVAVNGNISSIHLKGVKKTEITPKLVEKILSDDELIALFNI